MRDWNMHDVVNAHTREIMEMQQKQMDELIRRKLEIVKQGALDNNDFVLYGILQDIEESNIEKTRKELMDNGYELELDQPKPEMKSDGNRFTSVIDTEHMKIRVKKVIYEV